jgi:hypothetical protein
MTLQVHELQELASHLDTLEISTQADLVLAVSVLETAMDECDSLAAAKNEATAELRKRLTETLAPFKAAGEATEALVRAAKSAIVRHYETHELRAKAAIARRLAVPAPLARPKGLTVTRQLQLVSADPCILADEYLTAVPDTDAILAAVESGATVAGAETKIATSVSYRRSK